MRSADSAPHERSATAGPTRSRHGRPVSQHRHTATALNSALIVASGLFGIRSGQSIFPDYGAASQRRRFQSSDTQAKKKVAVPKHCDRTLRRAWPANFFSCYEKARAGIGYTGRNYPTTRVFRQEGKRENNGNNPRARSRLELDWLGYCARIGHAFATY